MKFLLELIHALRTAARFGTEKDGGPEGSRYIMISDTLANLIADNLEAMIAKSNARLIFTGFSKN